MPLCPICVHWAREAAGQLDEHHPNCPQHPAYTPMFDGPGVVIGAPVNGWTLRFVPGKEALTKTSFASLSNGRVIIDVYGHGPDGFVSAAEIISHAEAVRRAMLPTTTHPQREPCPAQ